MRFWIGFCKVTALARLVSAAAARARASASNERASCKSRGKQRRRRRQCRHRALSINDAPTTEKVIFEDGAPLINAFHLKKGYLPTGSGVGFVLLSTSVF